MLLIAGVLLAMCTGFLSPVRVVWTSDAGVTNAAALLAPGFGQVPERGWNAPAGCRLTTADVPAALLLDFGRELQGGVRLFFGQATDRNQSVRLRFGESVGEVMGDLGERNRTNDHAIRDQALAVPWFGSLSFGTTGFRFLRIDLVTPGSVSLENVQACEVLRPMTQKGAFRCSDERLNRIFDTAVRTVHLCCQDYLWDGIKRDRLVWLGDMYPETCAILSVYGADSILPESLDFAAATTAPDAWMNTMPTYTLWWVRNLAVWTRRTGDETCLRRQADYLRATLRHIVSFEEEGGWARGGFLDWPTQANEPARIAGTRALLKMTYDDAADLLSRLGDAVESARFATRAKALASSVPDAADAKSAAALLALSGLRSPREMYDRVLGVRGHDGVSTFYGYFMLEAMSAAGENARALQTIRDYWGGMLDMGATTFWEDFDLAWTNGCTRIDELPQPGRKDIHGDFGAYCYVGYRHSLCHGWSAGPAAWLLDHILSGEHFLGDLDWAEGTIVTKDGLRFVRVEKSPAGETLITERTP